MKALGAAALLILGLAARGHAALHHGSPGATLVSAAEDHALASSRDLGHHGWLVALALVASIGIVLGVGRLRGAGAALARPWLGRTGRRWAMLALAGALALAAFETGLHAVHHLDDPSESSTCVALAFGKHVSGVEDDAPALLAPAPMDYAPVPATRAVLRAAPLTGLSDTRAPPIRPSA